MKFNEFPILDDGIEVGILHRLNTEVHFDMHPQYRHWWITQRVKVNEFVRKLLAEDLITTRVPLNEPLSLKLVPRLGFTETWRDDTFAYYILNKLPFERKRNEQDLL